MQYKFRYVIDLDSYFKGNDIDKSRRVTSPYYLDKNNIPERGGLFDTEIFGELGTDERLGTHGYIELNQKIIHQMIYQVLLKKFRTFPDFILMKKVFIMDAKGCLKLVTLKEAEGVSKTKIIRTYDDLYAKWPQINWSLETASMISKQQSKLLNTTKKKRDQVFITKWIVTPAGTRDFKDKNSTETSRTSRDLVSIPEVNDLYVIVIRYANMLENNIDGYDENSIFRLQDAIENIYLYYTKRLPKKTGIIQKSYQAKASSSVLRGVLINQLSGNNSSGRNPLVGMGSIGIPLHMYIIGNRELFLHTLIEMVSLITKTTEVNGHTYNLDMEQLNNDLTDIKALSKLLQYFYESKKFRIREFKIGNQYIPMPLLESVLKRRVTYADMFWIVGEMITSDLHNSWVTFIRYPVLDFKATHFANPKIMSITHTMSIREKVEDYYLAEDGDNAYNIADYLVAAYKEAFAKVNFDNYPVLDVSNYSANKWYDGFVLHNPNCGDMGADFDGDTITVRFILSEESKQDARNFMNSVANYVNCELKSSRNIDANISTGVSLVFS